MSGPKELRERFSKPKDTSLHPTVADLIGIVSSDMREIVITDIEGMIDKNYRTALEGYILCLSRIIKHDLAWEYITKAFANKNEKVPSKYSSLFGKLPRIEELKEKQKT